MSKFTTSMVAGLIVASAITIMVHTQQIKSLNIQLENQKVAVQKLQEKNVGIIKQLNSEQKEKEALIQKNKQLEAKNKDLEGVRSQIIDTVGYLPSKEEIKLLEQLVEAEAGAEPYEGKVAVANVVFNRIHNKEYPDTISGVIYQRNQFEPVVKGTIYSMNPSSDSIKAVKEAVHGKKVIPSDIMNFWADYLPANNELWNHIPIEFKIGTTYFGKEWIN